MTELTKLTLASALDGLKTKAFSATEITQAFVDSIEASNDTLNAYVVKTPEKALEMAAASDKRIAAGEAGLLEGAPIGVKDLYCTKGVRTTACSNILGEFTPTYESTVTQQLGVSESRSIWSRFFSGPAWFQAYDLAPVS